MVRFDLFVFDVESRPREPGCSTYSTDYVGPIAGRVSGQGHLRSGPIGDSTGSSQCVYFPCGLASTLIHYEVTETFAGLAILNSSSADN
jgi:hypothetical protein